jgi:hypothetical protein
MEGPLYPHSHGSSVYIGYHCVLLKGNSVFLFVNKTRHQSKICLNDGFEIKNYAVSAGI